MAPADYATPARRAWLRELQTDVLEARRRSAIAWLGSRWLLHPDNAPRRRETPLTDAQLRLLAARDVLR